MPNVVITANKLEEAWWQEKITAAIGASCHMVVDSIDDLDLQLDFRKFVATVIDKAGLKAELHELASINLTRSSNDDTLGVIFDNNGHNSVVVVECNGVSVRMAGFSSDYSEAKGLVTKLVSQIPAAIVSAKAAV